MPARSFKGRPSGSAAEVWGTGGEIGYSVDGSHAELLAVPVASLRPKPKALSLEPAAAIGVAYLAAWLGLVEYAQLASRETLLVTGAGGGVGGAAAQIGKWRGARVIGVDRRQCRLASRNDAALGAPPCRFTSAVAATQWATSSEELR
jgi:NADPH:quinone reductase-like Zn-dependent oxidoreductase